MKRKLKIAAVVAVVAGVVAVGLFVGTDLLDPILQNLIDADNILGR